MDNKERLVEFLKDNDVCNECKDKECNTCWAYKALSQEADGLIVHGVFAPKVKIGDIVYFVYYDREDVPPVVIAEERVIDVSILGFTLSELVGEDDFSSGDFYKWEELDSGGWFFTKREDAEKRRDELMAYK